MKQKTAIRMGVCGVLVAFALIISVTAVLAAGAPGEDVSGFVLRDYHGRLAVFDAGDLVTPLTVTAVEISSLPEVDRDALAEGMSVASEEELILLLEDLNS